MGRATDAKDCGCPIIALDKFIQATRDSGYKSTAAALSELVDNSIQAGASRVTITIAVNRQDGEKGIEVSVLDDGCGMDPFTLRQALQFGGSSRFGDRAGLGRYGMGLPNASLSQAQRVTVFTWQEVGSRGSKNRARRSQGLAKRAYVSYLDVSEIARGKMMDVPKPSIVRNPPSSCVGPSGTLIDWTLCDRLDYRKVSTIVHKVEVELSRRFRHFIWDGLKITINGEAVKAFDPLYLHPCVELNGANLFGEELLYEIPIEAQKGSTAWVRVRFAELPVHEWSRWSNDQKRRAGITRGAGVSIVRAGREVDHGWFFMGGKNRENYDDWWRCEIQFDPTLDEAFGITHTKQQVRPQPYLVEALAPDLEAAARALNARARKAHFEVKAIDRFSAAEQMADEREHLLRPLPRGVSASASALMRDLKRSHPSLRATGLAPSRRYAIVEASLRDKSFYSYARDGERFVLVLNPDHPFYREIYKPLIDSDNLREQQLRAKLELMLLAVARSEAATGGKGDAIARHRLEWSQVLAAFLNDK